MNGPRINSDERGITINKPLAWVMLCGIVGAGIWIGTETTNAKNAIDNLTKSQEANRIETQAFRSGIDMRIRSLETARATDGSEISALRRDLTSFREDVQELKNLLRALEQNLRSR